RLDRPVQISAISEVAPHRAAAQNLILRPDSRSLTTGWNTFRRCGDLPQSVSVWPPSIAETGSEAGNKLSKRPGSCHTCRRPSSWLCLRDLEPARHRWGPQRASLRREADGAEGGGVWQSRKLAQDCNAT
ncbi:hypothetical protein B0T16DRAFT_490747, partial [Cercophora newfieldiana]